MDTATRDKSGVESSVVDVPPSAEDASPWPNRIPPISAEEAAASHRRMLAALEDIARRTPDENVYLGDRSLREAKEQLEALGPNASIGASWSARLRVALGEFRMGHEEAAIELFEELYGTFSASPAARKSANTSKVAFQLGVAYLRLAETQNCCQRYTTDSCVFPIQGKGVHQRPEASRKAVRFFPGGACGVACQLRRAPERSMAAEYRLHDTRRISSRCSRRVLDSGKFVRKPS